jgi:hypothetical protein
MKIDAPDLQSASEDSPDEDESRVVQEGIVLDRVKPEDHAETNIKRAKLVSQKGKSRYLDR